jgi:hypothetical protein
LMHGTNMKSTINYSLIKCTFFMGLHTNMRCRVGAVQMTPALLLELSCLLCVKGNTCIAKDMSSPRSSR